MNRTLSASSVYSIICISEGPGRGKTIGGESPVVSTGKLGIYGLIGFDSLADAPKAGFENLLSDESVKELTETQCTLVDRS